jgi:predicted amidohydrolase
MKICVAQTKPVKGDIQSNIINHKKLIALAVSYKADTIIFPELSLTGYEPELAKELAVDKDDSRLNDLQSISDTNELTIGVGVPIKNNSGINIGMVIFQSNKERQVYYKKYLHADEEPYFVSGQNTIGLIGSKPNIAFAICYEIFIPEHSENTFKIGAEIYIASVAKTINGVERAVTTLSGIANKYSMTVLMSNCIGHCDNFESAGKSSVWNNKGVLLGQLNGTNEGILIFDTDTEEVIEKII